MIFDESKSGCKKAAAFLLIGTSKQLYDFFPKVLRVNAEIYIKYTIILRNFNIFPL